MTKTLVLVVVKDPELLKKPLGQIGDYLRKELGQKDLSFRVVSLKEFQEFYEDKRPRLLEDYPQDTVIIPIMTFDRYEMHDGVLAETIALHNEKPALAESAIIGVIFPGSQITLSEVRRTIDLRLSSVVEESGGERSQQKFKSQVVARTMLFDTKNLATLRADFLDMLREVQARNTLADIYKEPLLIPPPLTVAVQKAVKDKVDDVSHYTRRNLVNMGISLGAGAILYSIDYQTTAGVLQLSSLLVCAGVADIAYKKASNFHDAVRGIVDNKDKIITHYVGSFFEPVKVLIHSATTLLNTVDREFQENSRVFRESIKDISKNIQDFSSNLTAESKNLRGDLAAAFKDMNGLLEETLKDGKELGIAAMRRLEERATNFATLAREDLHRAANRTVKEVNFMVEETTNKVDARAKDISQMANAQATQANRTLAAAAKSADDLATKIAKAADEKKFKPEANVSICTIL